MNRIIYIDGALADAMGSIGIKELAQVAATLAGHPVDVLTHGPSECHAASRYTAQPKGLARDFRISFGTKED